jgi:hypothetical protein
MNQFKLISLTMFNLVKQIWLLPQTFALSLQQRRRRLALNLFEAERLDRVRNPSKYLGR